MSLYTYTRCYGQTASPAGLANTLKFKTQRGIEASTVSYWDSVRELSLDYLEHCELLNNGSYLIYDNSFERWELSKTLPHVAEGWRSVTQTPERLREAFEIRLEDADKPLEGWLLENFYTPLDYQLKTLALKLEPEKLLQHQPSLDLEALYAMREGDFVLSYREFEKSKQPEALGLGFFRLDFVTHDFPTGVVAHEIRRCVEEMAYVLELRNPLPDFVGHPAELELLRSSPKKFERLAEDRRRRDKINEELNSVVHRAAETGEVPQATYSSNRLGQLLGDPSLPASEAAAERLALPAGEKWSLSLKRFFIAPKAIDWSAHGHLFGNLRHSLRSHKTYDTEDNLYAQSSRTLEEWGEKAAPSGQLPNLTYSKPHLIGGLECSLTCNDASTIANELRLRHSADTFSQLLQKNRFVSSEVKSRIMEFDMIGCYITRHTIPLMSKDLEVVAVEVPLTDGLSSSGKTVKKSLRRVQKVSQALGLGASVPCLSVAEVVLRDTQYKQWLKTIHLPRREQKQALLGAWEPSQ